MTWIKGPSPQGWQCPNCGRCWAPYYPGPCGCHATHTVGTNTTGIRLHGEGTTETTPPATDDATGGDEEACWWGCSRPASKCKLDPCLGRQNIEGKRAPGGAGGGE